MDTALSPCIYIVHKIIFSEMAMRWMAGAAGGAMLAIVAATAAAAQAPMVIRGVVTDLKADAVSVKPAKGPPQVIGLAPNWRVAVTRPIAVTEIKPGSFIGSAEMPGAEGVGRSLEVHVFPPGVKMGEGHYAWDKKKGSMMTNGTVGQIQVSKSGRELEVDYGSGKRKVVVPKNVPVVQITDGDRTLVKKGSAVFIVAAPGPDGKLMTNAISVGANGARPPM